MVYESALLLTENTSLLSLLVAESVEAFPNISKQFSATSKVSKNPTQL